MRGDVLFDLRLIRSACIFERSFGDLVFDLVAASIRINPLHVLLPLADICLQSVLWTRGFRYREQLASRCLRRQATSPAQRYIPEVTRMTTVGQLV